MNKLFAGAVLLLALQAGVLEFPAGGWPLSLLLIGALLFVVFSVLYSTGGGNGNRPTNCSEINKGGLGAFVFIAVGFVALCGIAWMLGYVPPIQ